MKQISENEISEYLRDLISEASADIFPWKVNLCINEDMPLNIDAQTVVETNGDYTIYIRPEALDNEYRISHEILHICVRRVVPGLIRVIEPNIIGMIGSELQAYLEHNWILAEQKRRGLEIDELKLFADIEETIGRDEDDLEKNIKKIITLCNIIHTHPVVYEARKDFFGQNNPKSLELAQKIMSHYPRQELYSNYEARKSTIQAIKEWNNIFAEIGFKSVNLNILLSVTPVFSAPQLKRLAAVVLGLMPNAIINQEAKTGSHVLYTMNDGQCCAIFTMDEKGLEALAGYMNKSTLAEFLELARMPYLIR